MSETEPVRPSIPQPFFEDDEQVIPMIQAGEPVWVQRENDSAFGRQVDFFYAGVLRGFLDEDDQGVDARIYVYPIRDTPGSVTLLNEGALSYADAAMLLQEAVLAQGVPFLNKGSLG